MKLLMSSYSELKKTFSNWKNNIFNWSHVAPLSFQRDMLLDMFVRCFNSPEGDGFEGPLCHRTGLLNLGGL